MKKNYLGIITNLLILSSCTPSYNGLDIERLKQEVTLNNYKSEVLILDTYSEYTTQVSNFSEIVSIKEEDFNSYYYVCIIVSSNAEELRNEIQFKKVEQEFDDYYFYFETTIEDEATDLAYFLTPFIFKVNNQIKMSENNIKVEVNRNILNKK